MNLFHVAHVLLRYHRRALHRRLVSASRRRWKRFFEMKPREPRIRVNTPPLYDARNSIDRFRRESGQR